MWKGLVHAEQGFNPFSLPIFPQLFTSLLFFASYLTELLIPLINKNSPAKAGDAGDVQDGGSIPGSGRSHGEGNGNPLKCSCLLNPIDRGAWRATVK